MFFIWHDSSIRLCIREVHGEPKMKYLEIIKLRSARKNSGLLEELLRSIDKFGQRGLVEMKTFHHAALETDLSAHLLWDLKQPERNGSELGLLLAQALKEVGLVDHSLWIEGEK
jgi:hypothetical protein